MKLSCNQFESLLSFYINNELTDNLKKSFEAHLCSCPACREKYDIIRSIISEIKLAYENLVKPEELKMTADSSVRTAETGVDEANGFELSAYIDNELPEDISIKIRQNIGSKPSVRRKIEKLYGLRKILVSSFNEHKNTLRTDYSKNIVRSLNTNYEYKQAYLHCLGFIMFVVSMLILSIFLVLRLV